MAVRIVLKRSSVLGKRPNSDILDPGELALNTNALTPGLFFEAENNEIIKVGPTAVGLEPPVIVPSLGETYYNRATGNLKVGDLDEEEAQNVWRLVSAPYLGGTDGFVTFVAPEFPNSTDSVENDGQSFPFKTLNRAVIEVAKRSILFGQSDRPENNRFLIVVGPGINPVYNGPGLPIPTEGTPADVPVFSANLEKTAGREPTVLELQQFNSEDGGLLIPRGTSIVGMDLRKTTFRPTYVPTSQNPTTGEGNYQPRSAVLKWTGNSYLNSFTILDKSDTANVIDIKTGLANEALFVSRRAHCFEYNQKINFRFTAGAVSRPLDRRLQRIKDGAYYVFPVGVDTFFLSKTPLDGKPDYLERNELPKAPQGQTIAICTTNLYSHNRLRAVFCAQELELNEFYEKVQLAYPEYFSYTVNQAEVINPGETEIVAQVPRAVSEGLASNRTANASAYANNVSIRSSYGMCGFEHDGNLITGFRSIQLGLITHISLQNDPIAYEVYTTVQDPTAGVTDTRWYTLQYATWASIPPRDRPSSPRGVSRVQQLAFLNSQDLVNIRWWYQPLEAQDKKTLGIPNFNRDFRHFSARSLNGAFIQAASCWSVGAAVGYWSYSGGRMVVTNCSSNFGSMALRSEGFAGIGEAASNQEALAPDTNFTFAGIRLPLRLTAVDTLPSRRLSLGTSVLSVINQGSVQLIKCGPGFQPINIQPFSLAPGTGIYVLNETVEYRAFFVNDGKTPVLVNKDGTITLRVRSADSSFPEGTAETIGTLSSWSSPFIKRWRDPRSVTDSSYSLILENTSPTHNPPSEGAVLRLNQNSPTSSQFLRPGVQFDPGSSGGWGRVLQVAYSQAATVGNSPQFNEVLLNRRGAGRYYVALNVTDNGVPWLQNTDQPHGGYTTYNDRNWYAASNDYWKGIYYSENGNYPADETLPPPDYNSPWAVTYCTERQELVENTYFGEYFTDGQIDNYPEGAVYFRGAQPAAVNYSFEFGYNGDNGSVSFGLLKYDSPTSLNTTTTEEVDPTETSITVTQTKDIFPDPKKTFVMASIAVAGSSRVEYVQVIGVDEDTNTITVIRGQYGTAQTQNWPIGAVVTVQGPGTLVDPVNYDALYTLSRRGIFRFLRIMGYDLVELQRFLTPKPPAERNVPITGIPLQLGKGYATALGPWPLEFAYSSQLDASAHSYYSSGSINYSRGLPEYNTNSIPTKQYYDLLCAKVWGGSGSATTVDEKGSIPLAGVLTQLETGRPYGTFTSLISANEAIDEVNQGGDGTGVTAIFTGPGLFGGPIYSTGTISMLAATTSSIGGIIVGSGLNSSLSGVLNLNIATETALGGIIVGDGLSITPTGILSADSQSGGVSQLLAGDNITLDPPDGKGIVKITSSGGGGGSKVIYVDDISSEFNGTKTAFNLSAGGTALTGAVPTSLLCVLGGIPQYWPTNFTIANGVLTFTTPPPTGASFFGMYFGGSYEPVPPVGGVTLINTGSGLVGGPITSTGTISIATSPATPGNYRNANITIDSAGRVIAASNGSGGGGGGASFVEIDGLRDQFDGVTKRFPLKVNGAPIPSGISAVQFFIALDGVMQNPGQAYTMAGSDIVFDEAPPQGTRFFGRYCDPTSPTLAAVPVVPPSPNSPGVEGDMAWDDTYLYIYTGSSWRRTLWSDSNW